MKGKIVQYNFADIEEEVYSLDYAIAWNTDRENVNIIPFTNKFCKESIESFCLGKIDNFVEILNEGFVENHHYVHLDKMVSVPKKKVNLVYQQDTHGYLLRDDNNNLIPAKITSEQSKSISNKMELFCAGEEKCLINILLKADPSYILDVNSIKDKNILNLGYESIDRYKEYNFDDDKILIFFINKKRYSVIMKKTNNSSNDLASRNNAIKELFTSKARNLN
ncbi:hypothetical protein KGF42_06265 [Clostridioides sp. ZZV15-6383]|uniref:hypothetical protein n=1 Tax=unclassified Clostridioides TaxID=2635829 RepID=UPI001D11CDA5|nr:hypothetical protein [Clostridioides sp. ZZV14-6345]MCC0699042.1 hypothetical protein [Clostridioides sp. ZZV15-6383]